MFGSGNRPVTSQTNLNRIGAVGAIAGAILLVVATSLHPQEADPNDPAAAFAEYAADDLWMATHLGQFIAVVAIAVGLIALSDTLRHGHAEAWATLGRAGAIASVAAAAALQAVDGIALKFVVDRWAASSPPQRDLVFEVAFGVRQIEAGLASLMSITFGLTVLAYGVALVLSRYSRWLGWIAGARWARDCLRGGGSGIHGFLSSCDGDQYASEHRFTDLDGRRGDFPMAFRLRGRTLTLPVSPPHYSPSARPAAPSSFWQFATVRTDTFRTPRELDRVESATP